MGRFSVYSFHNLLIQARIHQGVKKNHGIAQTNRTEMCHSFKSNLTSLHSTSRYSVYSNCESTFEQSLEHKSLSAETINRLAFQPRHQMLYTHPVYLLRRSLPLQSLFSRKNGMPWLLLLIWVTFNLGVCEAYLNVGAGAPCVGTIHLNINSSTSLTLIRDKRWAFYTDNSNSQYHIAPSRSFALIARDLCRIVFATPIWRSTCDTEKDEEANKRCLHLAEVLHQRAFIEPTKTTELWNRSFASLNRSTYTENLIKQK